MPSRIGNWRDKLLDLRRTTLLATDGTPTGYHTKRLIQIMGKLLDRYPIVRAALPVVPDMNTNPAVFSRWVNPKLESGSLFVGKIDRAHLIVLICSHHGKTMVRCPPLQYWIDLSITHWKGTPGPKFVAGILSKSSNCSKPPRLPKAGSVLDRCKRVPAGTSTS